jgi:hypothetical protein
MDEPSGLEPLWCRLAGLAEDRGLLCIIAMITVATGLPRSGTSLPMQLPCIGTSAGDRAGAAFSFSRRLRKRCRAAL